MKLKISHVTQYRYSSSVADSVNEIRLTPCTNERQSCYQHSITIEPNAPLFAYEDYFGNRVHAFSVNGPHDSLTIRTQMTVVTEEARTSEELACACRMAPDESWAWLKGEEAKDRFAEYLMETGYTEQTREISGFVASVPADEKAGVYEWLEALSRHIRTEFVYDPEATNVKTKSGDLLEAKRGVCQDFAHLMISACRNRGIPARYVSGYHFVGDLQGGNADFEQASHAWVEAFVPSIGWCGFDPTNESLIDERYVKLGHGLDYKDIVPVKGVYLGAGSSELHVTVDVSRIDE